MSTLPTSAMPTNGVSITIIFGRAGTGKSTALASMIVKCIESNKTYVVLTSTHSSLNNIYTIVNSKHPVDRSNFRTIYSFFRIDYENDIVAGCDRNHVPSHIFIDEFSLINKHVFKRIVRDLYCKFVSTKLILTGDAMQLNAIYKDKQYMSISKLMKISAMSKTKYIYPSVIEHIHLSIFGLKLVSTRADKRCLTVNHRNSGKVSSILNAIYSNDISFAFPFIDDINEAVALINRGYVFISSMYKHIQHIYDTLGKSWKDSGMTVKTIEQGISYRFGLKTLYLYEGLELMLTTTSTQKDSEGLPRYFNGEYVKWNGTFAPNNDLVCINESGAYIYVSKEIDTSLPIRPTYYPVIPKCLITIHKSQGQTIDNVIVCIDDLFDMCMLYTAITRARTDVKFYTFCGATKRNERLIESGCVNEFKQLNSIMMELGNRKNKPEVNLDDYI